MLSNQGWMFTLVRVGAHCYRLPRRHLVCQYDKRKYRSFSGKSSCEWQTPRRSGDYQKPASKRSSFFQGILKPTNFTRTKRSDTVTAYKLFHTFQLICIAAVLFNPSLRYQHPMQIGELFLFHPETSITLGCHCWRSSGNSLKY